MQVQVYKVRLANLSRQCVLKSAEHVDVPIEMILFSFDKPITVSSTALRLQLHSQFHYQQNSLCVCSVQHFL